MGALDFLSDYFSVTPKKKHKPMQTVEIKVKMDCDGCERRVRSSVSHMSVDVNREQSKVTVTGYVHVNREQSKVTVTGYVDRNKVLKRVQSTGKRAKFWPYVEYNLVAYPYVTQAYAKNAPSGFVRNTELALPNPNGADDNITSFFSDDNPNACSIM